MARATFEIRFSEKKYNGSKTELIRFLAHQEFYKSIIVLASIGQLRSYWVNSVTNKRQPLFLLLSTFYSCVVIAYNDNDEIICNYLRNIESLYTSVMSPAAIVEPA